MTFTFWGTDVALRVRRADYRARFYATIDGQPANALPRDENGAALVLTAPDPAEDYLSDEWLARARSERRAAIGAAPALAPDRRFFAPAFVVFFADSAQAKPLPDLLAR